jgi:hypothetical protein
MSKIYTTPTGERYPMKEAKYNVDFKVYRSDRRKAKQGDPACCLLALGILRNRNVLAVYIGSGHDAYVIFKATDEEEAVAYHFVIRTTAKKMIDAFDNDRSVRTAQITLQAPPPSWTLAGRRKNNARRRAEVKAGSPVKRRGKINKVRITRLGGKHRPRPTITKSGNVSMFNENQAAA